LLLSFSGVGVQAGPLRDSIRAVFDVNVFGVVNVTEAFIPLLKNSESPRLVFVSSTTGSIAMASDPNSPLHGGGALEYRSSKATLNMLMVLYANRLGGIGFKVHGANPGLVATNFHGANRARKPGAEPEVGGERIAAVVKGERDADIGKVVGPVGENGILPW
jgi:NAD(P)-dependent dehydrogenase (short-subunit alcohol dehydrogenase family)